MKVRLPGQGKSGMNFQKLAKQAQEAQEGIEQVSIEIDEKEYISTAGGGAVTVTITGKPKLQKIEINKDMVDISEDQELLCEMIIAAANSAIDKALAERDERIKALTGGIAVPGLF